MLSKDILGVEGSMSEVGIPPPHNSDKPHARVAVNTTNITTTTTITTVPMKNSNESDDFLT